MAKMAKMTKTKAVSKAKKTVPVKAAPVKKSVASVKVSLKTNKATLKVAPQQKSIVAKAKPIEAAIAKVVPKAAPVAVQKVEKLDFVAGDFVVYPAHGVGQVEGIEVQMISGMQVTLYTICFEKDRMRLKLPVFKVKASGLRKLSSKDRLKDALTTLQGRSQVRRIMWSRRAQEYEAKINSGDPVSIAEVLRDLKKEGDQGEQSYSERQIYQAALARLAREVAAIEQIDEKKAAEKLESVLGNVA
jgi:CarD family transcriptional regulator